MAMITFKNPQEWNRILKQLKQEYAFKPSVFLIREVMQRELGFVPRYYREYDESIGYMEIVCLDFYDEAAETFFRVKYLDR